MTKTETYKAVTQEVSTLLKSNKVTKKVEEQLLGVLDRYLKPANSVGSHPPKLDENGNIIEAYCRWHERYEKVEDMVMSNGKSKGYCKAAISKWNKANANIKRYTADMAELMADGKFEAAQEAAIEIKAIKDVFNTPAYYDYDEDWKVFNNNKKEA